MAEYYQTAGLDPAAMPRYTTMTEIMRDSTIQKNFESFRHKGGQVDKLRHLISTNTDLILKNAQYVANAASAAFPPSSAILTALTLVMKASHDVSKDYDKIMAFFDELNSFLERLQVLEQKLPLFSGYRNHLIRAFSAILRICGLTTKAIKEGRLKSFGKTILRGGEDDDLASASAALETAMKRLESATGFATLAGIQSIKEDTQKIDDKAEQQLGLLYGMTESLQSSHSENLEWFQDMSAKFDQMLQIQRKTARESDPRSESQNVDPGLRRRAAFNIVNRKFPDKNDSTSHRREIQHVLVNGTAEFILQRPELTAWMDRSPDHQVLWLTGQAGVGKTCVASLISRRLQLSTASNSNYSVATVFFKDVAYDEYVPRSVLCSIVNQIASRDVAYCEQAAVTELSGWPEPEWNKEVVGKLWEELIVSKFQRDSKSYLFLILDGVDECNDPEVKAMLSQRLHHIVANELHIHVLMTSRPAWESEIEDPDQAFKKINISQEDIRADMQMLIEARIQTSSRLYRCRKRIKQLIISQVLKKADSMLYIEHALRLLNRIHQEQLMLKQLRTLPESLFGLFDLLEVGVHAKRRPQQLDAIRTLFAWLAFARRPLSVSGANALLRMRLEDPFFSFEDELSGAAGAFLEIINTSDESVTDREDGVQEADEIVDRDQVDRAVFESSGSDGSASILRFRSRSLREFFTTVTTGESSLRSLQDTSHATILQLLVNLICGVGMQQFNEHETQSDETLIKYAVSSWLYHFSSISMENLTETQVCGVLRSLKLLLTNTNNATKVIEKQCPAVDGQIYFAKSLDWSREIYLSIKPVMIPWLNRGLLVGKDLIDQEEYAWVQRLAEQPAVITLDMVKGHIANWLKDPDKLITAYKLALSAIDPDDSTLPQFGHYWHAISPEALKQMAMIVSHTLDWNVYLSLGITHRYLHENVEALQKLEAGLEMVQNNVDKAVVLVEIVETGYEDVSQRQIADPLLQRTIAIDEAAQNKGDHEDANATNSNDAVHQSTVSQGEQGWRGRGYEYYQSVAQTAIDAIPADHRKDWLHHIRRCIILRARCEQKLGHTEEALSSYNEARSILPNDVMEPRFYYFLAKLVHDALGPKAMLERVQAWNFFELMAWLCADFRVDQESYQHYGYHRVIFHESARATGNGLFVAQVYEAIIKFQEMRGGGTPMRLCLALFYLVYYRNDPQVVDKAKVLLNQVLRSKSQINLATGYNEVDCLDEARDRLAELLYEQFRYTSELTSKQQFLGEMRKIQEENVNNALYDTNPSESSTAIIYACMLRKVSSNSQFQDVLERLFQSCVKALSDTDSSNDQASLVLLAKVLACVPGLERDARIAFSAKYSILDQKIALTSEDGTYGLSDIHRDDANDKGVETESIPENSAEQQSENKDEESTVEWKEERFRYKSHEKWGDILPSDPIKCSGNSEHVIRYWESTPIYVCITYIDVHLCAACFENIKLVNCGEKAWNDIGTRRFCGEDHRYIKGPIEGWKGIRDGVIVIEREDVETRMPFKDWLEDLKMNRWKRAWEAFWKREDLVNVLE